MGNLFRTKENQEAYQRDKRNGSLDTCPLCTVPAIKDWKHWKVIKNKYPYDLIAKEHDMLVSKRHVTEDELTLEEKEEMFEIKKEYINKKYGYIFEPIGKNKSIPKHFHIHLIVEKDILS